jgi:triacylglycerol lipase
MTSGVVGRLEKPAVVLAHGLVHPLGALSDLVLKETYFRGVSQALRLRGYRVLEPRVSAMGHVAERAAQLRELVSAWDERERGERVVVLAHSMGGLDARWMVSKLRGDELIHSLVTVGTPHRGCSVADFVVDDLPLLHLEKLGVSLRALECLTVREAGAFNRACPDADSVRYFSVSGQKGDDDKLYTPILRPSHKYVRRREGPNDGMVSVASSKWGVHLGVVDRDHIEQIDSLALYSKVLSLFQGSRQASAAAAAVGAAGAARVSAAGHLAMQQLRDGSEEAGLELSRRVRELLGSGLELANR